MLAIQAPFIIPLSKHTVVGHIKITACQIQSLFSARENVVFFPPIDVVFISSLHIEQQMCYGSRVTLHTAFGISPSKIFGNVVLNQAIISGVLFLCNFHPTISEEYAALITGLSTHCPCLCLQTVLTLTLPYVLT